MNECKICPRLSPPILLVHLVKSVPSILLLTWLPITNKITNPQPISPLKKPEPDTERQQRYPLSLNRAKFRCKKRGSMKTVGLLQPYGTGRPCPDNLWWKFREESANLRATMVQIRGIPNLLRRAWALGTYAHLGAGYEATFNMEFAMAKRLFYRRAGQRPSGP